MSTPPAKRQKCDNPKAAVAKPNKGKDGDIKMPKKKNFRQRAHANPFSDHQLDYPLSPAHMDWASYYPAYADPDPSKTNLNGARKLLKDVEVVDIGCGYGGLLVGLAPLLPDTLMVGMEIRVQVLDYLQQRIQALRNQQKRLKTSQPDETPNPEVQPAPASPTAPSDAPNDNGPVTPVAGRFENISAIRSNTMKFLPNFFARHQLSKIFVCFPDPHFKARKHKARIISESLNAEYAYAVRPGGYLYTITDVEDYHHWILKHFHERSPLSQEDEAETDDQAPQPGVKDLWERVSDEELERDECVRVMKEATEEGKKVTRNKGNKYVAVFRRKADPEWPA
ncbi:tRNA (guanine-N(7)-)-methyltransferase (tRNA(m7G46)-methyltransferase) [Aspergillus wentii]|nr:tRNA (guanine-N(7)-)-methyltransferase (tRNA(m7G46)-methyltransferase) [Aspergillus wentii]